MKKLMWVSLFVFLVVVGSVCAEIKSDFIYGNDGQLLIDLLSKSLNHSVVVVGNVTVTDRFIGFYDWKVVGGGAYLYFNGTHLSFNSTGLNETALDISGRFNETLKISGVNASVVALNSSLTSHIDAVNTTLTALVGSAAGDNSTWNESKGVSVASRFNETLLVEGVNTTLSGLINNSWNETKGRIVASRFNNTLIVEAVNDTLVNRSYWNQAYLWGPNTNLSAADVLGFAAIFNETLKVEGVNASLVAHNLSLTSHIDTVNTTLNALINALADNSTWNEGKGRTIASRFNDTVFAENINTSLVEGYVVNRSNWDDAYLQGPNTNRTDAEIRAIADDYNETIWVEARRYLNDTIKSNVKVMDWVNWSFGNDSDINMWFDPDNNRLVIK